MLLLYFCYPDTSFVSPYFTNFHANYNGLDLREVSLKTNKDSLLNMSVKTAIFEDIS